MILATDPKRIAYIRKIDSPHWQEGTTNVAACLLSQTQKADNDNTYQLSKIEPDIVDAFRQWEAERWLDVHCEKAQPWAEGYE